MLWYLTAIAYGAIVLALLGSILGLAFSLASQLLLLGVILLVGIMAYKHYSRIPKR